MRSLSSLTRDEDESGPRLGPERLSLRMSILTMIGVSAALWAAILGVLL